jgi:23S rRNA pseudouridine1911/1915/1917 synthase
MQAEQAISGESSPLQWHAEGAAGLRLDRFVTDCLNGAGHPVSRTRIQDWIRLGAVRVNDELCSASQKLSGTERVEVWPQPLEASNAFCPDPMALKIAHLDEQVLIIDKPAGLVVHPAPGNWRGTLMNGLLHWRPSLCALPRAGIVHRLDRDTSGLLMVGLDTESIGALQQALAARLTHRIYLAWVHGNASRLDGSKIDCPIGRDPVSRVRMACGGIAAKPASTSVRLLVKRELADGLWVSLLSCKLDTGRTHQIRVHLTAKGFALLGDPLYGRVAADKAVVAADHRYASLIESGQALHASLLQLPHPKSASNLRVVSAPPWDHDLTVAGLNELAHLWQLTP